MELPRQVRSSFKQGCAAAYGGGQMPLGGRGWSGWNDDLLFKHAQAFIAVSESLLAAPGHARVQSEKVGFHFKFDRRCKQVACLPPFESRCDGCRIEAGSFCPGSQAFGALEFAPRIAKRGQGDAWVMIFVASEGVGIEPGKADQPPGTFHTFQEFFLGERGGVAALIKARGSIVARDCNAIERRQGSKKRQRSEKRHRSSFRVCLALLRGCSNHAPLSCVMQAGGPRLACSEAAIR